MNTRAWLRSIGVAAVTVACLGSAHLWAQTTLSDGYQLEDFELLSAGSLVNICTLDADHPHHEAARAFCYGFFEGATQYDRAISSSPSYERIVCNPPETTRTDAVEVYVSYVQANSQYASEAPIDAIFRALIAKWPCDARN